MEISSALFVTLRRIVSFLLSLTLGLIMLSRVLDALRARLAVAPVLYWLDFVLYPVIALAVVAYDCRSGTWLAWCALGVLLFTFVEYWAHRTVLHWFFFHSQHERHHTHPDEYVVFPFWYTPAIFAGFFVCLPLSIFAGVVIGYVWFLVWHHILHHCDLSRLTFARRYAIWHLAHHREDDCNFGITVPIWDFVFRTYRRPPAA